MFSLFLFLDFCLRWRGSWTMAPRSDLSLQEKSPAKAQNIQGKAPSKSNQQTFCSSPHRHTPSEPLDWKSPFVSDLLICITLSDVAFIRLVHTCQNRHEKSFFFSSPPLRCRVPSNRIRLHIIARWHHPASGPSCFANPEYLMHVFACSRINIQTQHSHLTVNVAM